METFKSSLQDFAQKHQKDIRKDPTFRSHFQRMCANIGVDPLASNKGFWADLLGVGDFYYELGVQVIEACITSRDNDGGLTELEEVLRRVKLMRGITSRSNAKRGTSSSNLLLHRSGSGFLLKKENDLPQIIEDDIIRAIKILKPLSGGYEVLQIGNRKLVRSVPKELDKDQSSLLLLAQVSFSFDVRFCLNDKGTP
ncbi:EAP30/Vps36 family-domain-containing protein [Mycotypha africana]|uniref:EAP30/Vps36 family-domain-containing protein n=1 Tax=Mycotypha africana TaxID=64632 RepID=UPI002301A72B|nr:EAP30/Vps36 family-domain-containing protein [Mycotypha africana]KAI8983934.1 EAP30/Vps36 family-domain-containing protein [Mycotypha africana]